MTKIYRADSLRPMVDSQAGFRITDVSGDNAIAYLNTVDRVMHTSGKDLDAVQGSSSMTFATRCYVHNGMSLRFYTIREADGSDWMSAGYRIQSTVDLTHTGYLQFNGSSNPRGISFGKGNESNLIGSEFARFDEHGNFGLGTLQPSARLTIGGGTVDKAPIRVEAGVQIGRAHV